MLDMLSDAEELARRVHTLPAWPFGADLRLSRVSGGITNDNWRLSTADGIYFLKVPGIGTDAFIDRALAHEAAEAAARVGAGPQVLYFDPGTGIEVTEFLDGYVSSTWQSITAPEVARSLARMYRRLHDAPLLSKTKTVFDMIDEHVAQLQAVGREFTPFQRDVLKRWEPIQEAYVDAGLELVAGHNDPNPPNFMTHPEGPMMLVDYDYAANTDRYYELGGHFALLAYSDEARNVIVDEYWGEPTPDVEARLWLSGIATAVKWGHWALYNAEVRQSPFDYEKYGNSLLMRAYELMCAPRTGKALHAL